MAKRAKIKNAIVISDLHAGCQFGLCPERVILDGGGYYQISKFQKALLECWNSFWMHWVPRVTRGEDYCVIVNGDAMDHRHHGTTTQISQNIADQINIAYELLAPIAEKCNGLVYLIRGTRAHSGPSAEAEEQLARELKTIQDESGNYSRYEMYINVGKCLVHVSHHIGVTGSAAYETSALMSEYANACVDAAKWGLSPPDVIVRSHRHVHTEVRVPTARTYGYVFVTSGWQLKPGFAFTLVGGRVRQPMVGGSLIRQGDEEFYTRHKTWDLKRPRTENPKS